MKLDIFLSSIISATSIIVGIGFPFIVYLVTNHNDRKAKLLLEIKSYHPKLFSFQELVYNYFQIDLWKSSRVLKLYKVAIRKKDDETVKNLLANNDFPSPCELIARSNNIK